MKIKVYDHTGKELETLDLKPSQFGSRPNDQLLAQALRVYTFNSHQHTSKVKTRSEVTGSRRKIWRQKGTGRARHGDRYAPLFVGGGVAHGPTGLKPNRLVLPKKMKRQALATALLYKLKNQNLALIKDFSLLRPKTAFLANLLSQIANHPRSKVLIIAAEHHPSIYLSARNLQQVTVKRAQLVNAYDIVFFDKIIASPQSLEIIKSRIKTHSS